VLIHICWKGKFILTVFNDISMQPGTIKNRCTRLVFWSFLFCPNNTVKNHIFRQRFPGLVPLLQWRFPGILLLLQRLLYMLHLLFRGEIACAPAAGEAAVSFVAYPHVAAAA
jgi:hypothetical protein